MKIAMAMERFSRHAGGAESYAVELARTLVSEGWEVHFFGHSWDGEPKQAIFHSIPRLPSWVPPSVQIMTFALRHRTMMKRQHFDVVLGFGNTLEMNVYQSHGGVHFLSSMRKLRAVRNPLLRFFKMLALFAAPKYHARAWIESAPFRKKNRPVIIAISDMIRNDMSQYFHIDKEKIRLVYNGIDVRRFGVAASGRGYALRKNLGFDDEVLFLFMAYDFRKKGVRCLIEAVGNLKEKIGEGRFGVVVVGGPPSSSLNRLVRKLDLSKSVVFHGPTKEPELFYQACDVFLLPTFYDACSLVVFEAMAAGLPAITTMFNGAAGIITPGVDGTVLKDPRNVKEMASAMEFFLERDVLKSASEAARRTALKHTLETNHREIIDIIEEIVEQNRNVQADR
jgi:UDP-glucose:(heptosyl)LPS alpha-1,3-glucosyltransferase